MERLESPIMTLFLWTCKSQAVYFWLVFCFLSVSVVVGLSSDVLSSCCGCCGGAMSTLRLWGDSWFCPSESMTVSSGSGIRRGLIPGSVGLKWTSGVPRFLVSIVVPSGSWGEPRVLVPGW